MLRERTARIANNIPETGKIDAAQIRTGLVFETSRLGLSDVPADRRRGRSRSSDDDNVRQAENTARALSIGRRRRFLGERKVSFHDLPCIAVDPLSLATVSVGLEPRLPASAAIPAPLRSLRIGSLSRDVQAQTHPSYYGPVPEFSDDVSGKVVWCPCTLELNALCSASVRCVR